MINVGLTGGIGSGKSTVLKLFETRGAVLIDFDELAHRVEEPETETWKKIVDHFGKDVLHDDGTINRAKLGAIVFGCPAERAALNAIVHPAVFEEWRRRIDEAGHTKHDAVIISDVPLLIEADMQSLFDCIILVYLPPEAQIERIMKRNGFTRREAEERLAAQMPIGDKIPLCDFVIENDGSIAETERKVDDVWNELATLRDPGERPRRLRL
jgi:dephospho-CoA kinase